MTGDSPTTETWAEKKIARRELLKKAALGGAALGVLYVAPNFTTTGAKRAYATTGATGAGCEEVGRPTRLQVCYNGQNSGGSNDQADGAWGTSGAVDGANPVWIVAGNYNGGSSTNGFNGPVALNGCFFVEGTGPGSKVGPNTEFTIYDQDPDDGGTQLMHVFFHTSCSQPLEPGDQFGPIVVSQFIDNA